jgi:protein-S-isoprenylcysteine O-methyltransferase Ste14
MRLLDPWNVAYLVGFVVFYWIRGVFVRRTKTETKTLRRVDRLEKALLIAMAPPTLLLPLLYLFTPVLAFADYRLPLAVRAIGAATMAASLWLFWRSHADLGQNWSVSLEIRQNHALVERGVYRYVRHPMYAAIWLWAIAQGMLLENWLAGWSVVPAFAAMYFLRTPREERMMCDAFGDDYRRYMQRTGRLWPRIWARTVGDAAPHDAADRVATQPTIHDGTERDV